MSDVEGALFHYAQLRGYSLDKDLMFPKSNSQTLNYVRPPLNDLVNVNLDIEQFCKDLSTLSHAVAGPYLDSIIIAAVVRAISNDENSTDNLNSVQPFLSESQHLAVTAHFQQKITSPLPTVQLLCDEWSKIEQILSENVKSPSLYQLVRDSVQLIDSSTNPKQQIQSNHHHLPSSCRFYRITSCPGRPISCAICSYGSMIASGTDESTIIVSRLRPDAPSLDVTNSPTNLSLNFPAVPLKAQYRSKKDKQSSPDLLTLHAHSAAIYDLQFVKEFNKPSQYLLSCSGDRTVRLFDLWQSGTNVVAYDGHTGPVWKLDISADNNFFATASLDSRARLFSFQRLHPLRVFASHTDSVDCIKFHPNGSCMATGSSDGTVRLFSLQDGKCIRMFHGFSGGGSEALAFSQDGKWLCCAGEDRKLYIWEVGSGELLTSIKNGWHDDQVHSMTFANQWLMSGDASGMLRIANGASNVDDVHVLELPYHASVMDIQYLQNDRALLSAGAVVS